MIAGGRFRDWAARRFHRHEWVKIAVVQDVDPAANVRYGIRRYRCQVCGRIRHEDGRHDRLEPKAVYAAPDEIEELRKGD